MNLPNILTILRILMAVVFVAIFPINTAAALLIFILASITDYFDGYLARKYDLITHFGKIMDPIADKVLILCAFGMFAVIQIMWWWMFWAIAIREIGVTVFRFWAISKGEVLAAEKAGKLKTAVQMATIIVLLISVSLYPEVFSGKVCPVSCPFYVQLLIVCDIILLFVAVAITVISGIAVFWNNRMLFGKDKG